MYISILTYKNATKRKALHTTITEHNLMFVAIMNHLWGHPLLPCQNNTGTKYTGCHPSVDGVWNFHKGADTVLVALYR